MFSFPIEERTNWHLIRSFKIFEKRKDNIKTTISTWDGKIIEKLNYAEDIIYVKKTTMELARNDTHKFRIFRENLLLPLHMTKEEEFAYSD